MNLDEILAKDLNDFWVIKEALGFSRSTYELYMNQFIQFCAKYYPDASSITKSIVVEWICVRPGESVNTQNRRITVLRNFTKYQDSIGKENFHSIL